MSLINYITSDEFILFCAEQRAIDLTTGKPADGNFIKVKKSKNNVLFGFGGHCQDNYEFCPKYLNYDMTLNALTDDADYCEIRDYLRDRLEKYKLSEDFDKAIACCIGGWDGFKLCISIFHVNSNCDEKITSDEIYSTGIHDMRYGSLIFNEIHLQNFKTELNKLSNFTILNFKNAFKTTVEKGMKFDNSINNNFSFEVLKRKDFL